MLFQPFGRYSDLILALVALAVSWLLLRLERRGLDALGFDQPARRFREFIAAFGFMGVAVALVHLISAWLGGVSWQWNPAFRAGDYFEYELTPVLAKAAVVALVFQGYLLRQWLRFAGPTLGLYSAAIAFGLYDVFALHAAGNISRALAVFLASGAYGFVLALAFRQTGSLAAPLGLNLAWHFVGKTVFAGVMPVSEMFILPENARPENGAPFGGIVGMVVIAGALVIYSWWLLRRYGIETVRTES